MSDEELRNHLHQFAITYNPLFKESRMQSIDSMLAIIKQHREAYAIEARLDEAEKMLGYDIFGTMQRLERTNDAINRRIAELREKVGRDDTK